MVDYKIKTEKENHLQTMYKKAASFKFNIFKSHVTPPASK